MAMRNGPKCGAHAKRKGKPCEMPAGARTDHPGTGRCWLHGGRGLAEQPQTPTMQEWSDRQAIESLSRLGFEMGKATPRDPQQVLLEAVSLSAFRAESLAYRVRLLGSDLAAAEGARERAKLQLQIAALEMQYDSILKTMARSSKMALDAGIARRQVEMAERQGNQIFIVVHNTLVQLGLQPAQMEQARQLLAGEFRKLAEKEAASVRTGP